MLCLVLITALVTPPTCPAEVRDDTYTSGAYEELQLLDDLAMHLSGSSDIRREENDSRVRPLTGIARRVAYCESGLRNSHNPNSTASGYFQFLDGTWNWVTDFRGSAADYPLSDQLDAFYELWEDGEGATHWQPSRYCWEYEQPWEHYDR